MGKIVIILKLQYCHEDDWKKCMWKDCIISAGVWKNQDWEGESSPQSTGEWGQQLFKFCGAGVGGFLLCLRQCQGSSFCVPLASALPWSHCFPSARLFRYLGLQKLCTFGFRPMPRSQFGTITVCFPTRAEIPMVCFQGQGLIIIVSKHLAEKSGQWVLACISYAPQTTEQPPSGILPVKIHLGGFEVSGRNSVLHPGCYPPRLLQQYNPFCLKLTGVAIMVSLW